MNIFRHIAISLLAGIALATSSVSGAATTNSFTAIYKLTKSGIPLGTAKFRLKPAKHDGCYIYSGHAKPNAVVRLLIGDINEKTRFCIVDDEIRPQHYHHHIDGKPGDSYTLNFDWSAMTVHYTGEDGDDKTYPLKPGTQDAMSLQIAARHWLASAATDDSLPGDHKFILADDDGTEDYQVHVSDGGTLKLPSGHFDTVKLSRSGKHHHAMTFWMARYADWIPVEVKRIKDGSTRYTLTLQSLSRQD